MIRSMTGFGTGEVTVEGRRFTVEVRTVNHRFLNIGSRMPQELNQFEQQIQGLVKGGLSRGQVNIFAGWDGKSNQYGQVVFNMEAATQAASILRATAEELGLSGDITLEQLLVFPAVTSQPELTLDAEELWARISPAFSYALAGLNSMREREGVDLERDLRARLAAIGERAKLLEELSPGVVAQYKEKLEKRVEELTEKVSEQVIQERLQTEIALFADKADISEELVRLESHVDKFGEMIEEGGVVGRKMEFLLQEMNREINTVGSKGSDAEIARIVVEVKAELEKMREQIQNVE